MTTKNEHSFVPGDVVIKATGGPLMTVGVKIDNETRMKIPSKDGTVFCQWFTGNLLNDEDVDVRDLVLIREYDLAQAFDAIPPEDVAKFGKTGNRMWFVEPPENIGTSAGAVVTAAAGPGAAVSVPSPPRKAAPMAMTSTTRRTTAAPTAGQNQAGFLGAFRFAAGVPSAPGPGGARRAGAGPGAGALGSGTKRVGDVSPRSSAARSAPASG